MLWLYPKQAPDVCEAGAALRRSHCQDSLPMSVCRLGRRTRSLSGTIKTFSLCLCAGQEGAQGVCQLLSRHPPYVGLQIRTAHKEFVNYYQDILPMSVCRSGRRTRSLSGTGTTMARGVTRRTEARWRTCPRLPGSRKWRPRPRMMKTMRSVLLLQQGQVKRHRPSIMDGEE